VSQTDCAADFTTIQGAISSLPDNNTNYTILVMPGMYIEQLNVTRSAPLTILGQTPTPNEQGDNTVTVYWASANSNGRFTDNAFTSVLTVAPNLAASLTGSGNTGYPVPAHTPFGCIDFRVYNIDFRNVATEISAGPSLAVSISRANAGFYFSGFYSYQDTVMDLFGIKNTIANGKSRSMSASWEMLTSTVIPLLAKQISSMVSPHRTFLGQIMN
jgi:pectinesterase